MKNLQQLESCRGCEFFVKRTVFCKKHNREIKGMEVCELSKTLHKKT